MSSEIEQLLVERGKTHGPFPVFAGLAQELKMLVHLYGSYKLDQEKKEAMDMILHKIARIVTGDSSVKDHWDDLAGYATLGSKSIRSPTQGVTDDGNQSATEEGQTKTAETKSHRERPCDTEIPPENYTVRLVEKKTTTPYYSYNYGVHE